MQLALRLAARHLGAAGENPSVGCVLVKDACVVGTGVTAIGGRPHAEAQAIQSAGAKAKGATAYVTLEPCSHHGQTPPCTRALIEAGIARVVIACVDADARVAGSGIKALKESGIAVDIGVCEAQAALQHFGFFRRLTHGLPRVTVKLARSADGFMGYQDSTKRNITGELARRHGQALRARSGAVITGIDTVLNDDPMLNVRIAGLENRSPKRVVLDRTLRILPKVKLVQTARETDTIVITTQAALQKKPDLADQLQAAGVRIIPELGGDNDFQTALHIVAELGVNHVMIEAGPTVSKAALASNLVDVVYDYRSKTPLGAAGNYEFSKDLSQKSSLLYQIPLETDTLSVYALSPLCLPD